MQNISIEGFQISPQQKRLWLLQQASDRQAYRVQCEVLVEGDLKKSILELALQKVFAKHEILRTSLQMLKGMALPLQIISYNSRVEIQYHDLKDLEVDQQNVKIKEIFQEQSQKCFDLENGSVLDFSVARISSSKYILFIAISAFCADTISIHKFLREIIDTYNACLQQKELADEPLQYADIAAWQNELLVEEDTETAREYWRKQNIDNLVIGKLPNEKLLEENSVFNPKFISINLNLEIVAIAELAQKSSASVSTFLMACWQILLWRLTGSEMAIALCCDGRNYEELKPALGLLAKYIPVRGNLQENCKFSEIWQQLDKTASDVYQLQETFSWEEIVAGEGNSRELSFLPFAFDFVAQPTKYLADNVSFSIQKQYSCIERFKVKLSCWHWGDSLAANLYYDASLFDEKDIERLAEQFQTLLASAINNPETAIAQLEILSPQERQQLLVEFNHTKSDLPPYQSIIDWFEAQVNTTPDNVAVVFEKQQLTYQELNDKANKIAHHLASLGVQPEVVVALCVERSLDLAVGILGILKAGGAYLPLDPALPAEALALRLQDAQAPVLLTQKHLVGRINVAQDRVQVVCLDAGTTEDISSHTTLTASSENLAYVIYTSGSTGQPKGVAVEHRQLLNYVSGILAKLNLPVGASFATVSTFAADLGNTAIFSALCTGGCLHIISQECATDPVALADYCHHHRIDCLKIVPSHLSALLTAKNAEQILPRQCLILGGEACNWELIQKVQQYAPDCQIFNHYGPTETTIGVLTYAAEFISSHPKSATVPLGCPLANTQIYLLDNYKQPVPLGVAGEIYIGGDSVARGYLNQPEMTAERFIDNPFTDFGLPILDFRLGDSSQNLKFSRLYKTGDLARYLPNGDIEFLGRIDDQVKLRGFRIELGEIEAVLSQHPEVQQAVVTAREDDLGNKQLLAYVVPDVETQNSAFIQNPKSKIQNLKSDELRSFLKQKLPEYMLPANFVQLRALPLTANGKVDRRSLPAPDTIKPEAATFVAPRTSVEKALAEIWSQILGIEQVGIHDNFFTLGGDSILSIQAIAKANQVGLRLTPKQIFEYQTIAQLAAIADTTPQIQSEQGLVTGSVPLTPIQHSFFEQNFPEPHHWNQSLLLELRQTLDPKLLQQAVQHLLEHHDALRLRFRPEADGWQAINAGSDKEAPFIWLDLSTMSEEKQKSVIEATSTQLQASLNLFNGPLMRVVLFNLGHNLPSRLLLVIHHLAVDGVSWRILLADLQTALEQLSRGEAIHLPPKTTSFKQWAELLQEYGRTKAVHSELDYWRSQQTQMSVPVDYPGGANTIATSRTVSVFLSKVETQALLQEVPAAYQTQVNDVLLTALTQAFVGWTGQQSLLVNLEGHGREEIFPNVDLSRTVGWFTTLFPVLLDLSADSPGDALKAVKEQLRHIPNRGIGYGVLRYFSGDRAIAQSLAAMPQAEICFNYLGQFDQALPQSSWFSLAPEPSGSTRSPLASRRHLLDINGYVSGGQLRLDWTYSTLIHKEATVSRLAEEFINALRELITHCQSPSAKGYTPSDFPKANLNQKDLDRLLAKINLGSEKKTI
jgi:amino acid adenylation domain-containing protein/non-ribosomal peptide synthase protein (TIGR01720 family)